MEDEKILDENLQDIVSRIFECNIRSVTSCFLKYIKVASLYSLQLVSKKWNKNFKNCLCWKYFLSQMIDESDEWNSFAHECDLFQYLHFPPERLPPEYFRETIIKMIQSLKEKYTPYHIKLNNPTQVTIPIEDSDIMCYTVVRNTIYLGHRNSKITIWNIKSGKKQRVLTENTDSVTHIVYDDYSHVVSGSNDGYIRLWDLDYPDIDCLDATYYSHEPIKCLSFFKENLFAYTEGLSEIWYYTTYARCISYMGRISLSQPNFIEMRNTKMYLITRFESEILSVFNFRHYYQERNINNYSKVIFMDVKLNYLITCSLDCSIRIFALKYGYQCVHISGLSSDIIGMSVDQYTILLAKTDGFVQKICFKNRNFKNEDIDLIDEHYLKIEEGIVEIKGYDSKIICHTRENFIKLIKVVKQEYLKNEYWKPRYVRSIEGNMFIDLDEKIWLLSLC